VEKSAAAARLKQPAGNQPAEQGDESSLPQALGCRAKPSIAVAYYRTYNQ